jgi:hypothetical protein
MIPRYEIMKHYWRFPLLSFLCLLLVACGASSDEAAETQPVDTQRLLVCTDECRQRGQCGQNQNQEWVVLGHNESPQTSGHNVLFPNNQEVGIAQTQMRQVRTSAGQQLMTANFYYVTLLDGSRAGWVAEWCVVLP